MSFDYEIRRIVSETAGVRIDSLYSDTKLESIFDDDSHLFFWRTIEQKYGWVVTRGQKEVLATIGEIVSYCRLRYKAEAKG
jgi:hypothetical protein